MTHWHGGIESLNSSKLKHYTQPVHTRKDRVSRSPTWTSYLIFEIYLYTTLYEETLYDSPLGRTSVLDSGLSVSDGSACSWDSGDLSSLTGPRHSRRTFTISAGKSFVRRHSLLRNAPSKVSSAPSLALPYLIDPELVLRTNSANFAIFGLSRMLDVTLAVERSVLVLSVYRR